MADRKHLELLAKGPERWNDWRRTHSHERPDLRDAYLAEADLSELDCRRADFSRAVLMGAKFDAADLRNAVFADCDLRFADFRGARLRGARFDAARGVPRRIARAAARAPAPWRRRPSAHGFTIAAIALSVCGICLVLSWLRGTPLAASARSFALADGLNAPERLILTLREVRSSGLPLAAVDIDGDVLTMRIDLPAVGEEVFLPVLGTACNVLVETDDIRLREIRVLDRSGAGGWLYQNPANCRTLVESPLETVRLVAAADSRPL